METGIKISRRNNLQLFTPTEMKIYEAIDMIEKMGADIRLTDAQMLLGEAKDQVSDYIDEQLTENH